VRVALTDGYIALCEAGWFKSAYHYYTQLDYELKFEVIYEKDELNSSTEASILSRRVGFRLIRAGSTPVEFIIVSGSAI
jgi:hypothetical protein